MSSLLETSWARLPFGRPESYSGALAAGMTYKENSVNIFSKKLPTFFLKCSCMAQYSMLNTARSSFSQCALNLSSHVPL